MKKLWQKIKEWVIWMCNPHVLEMINEGRPYEEIEAYVKEKAKK